MSQETPTRQHKGKPAVWPSGHASAYTWARCGKPRGGARRPSHPLHQPAPARRAHGTHALNCRIWKFCATHGPQAPPPPETTHRIPVCIPTPDPLHYMPRPVTQPQAAIGRQAKQSSSCEEPRRPHISVSGPCRRPATLAAARGMLRRRRRVCRLTRQQRSFRRTPHSIRTLGAQKAAARL